MPHRFDQVVLADHALAIAHQMHQQVEHLRLHGDQPAGAPQLAALDIKYMILKEKLHVGPVPDGGGPKR